MRLRSFIFLIFLSTVCHAQYEGMLHKTFKEKTPALVHFYGNVLKIMGPAFPGQDSIIASLRAFGKKHQDESLVAEASLAAAWMQAVQSPIGSLDDKGMLAFIEDQQQAKDAVSVARTWRMLGDQYWQKNHDYETALECYLKNIEAGKGLAEDVYPEKMYDYSSLGNIYYHFKEYRQAMVYLTQALTYEPPFTKAVIQSDIRNTLGLYYLKTGNLDSSDYYFNEILQNETDRHEEWKGIAMGNLGYNYFLRGQYAKAIPMLEQDMAIAAKYNTPHVANESIICLATIYLKQNNINRAEALARQAEQFIIEKKVHFDQYEFLYPVLSKLAAVKGDFVKSQVYLDSALFVKDSVAKKFNALQLARAEQKGESVRRHLQLAALEQEKASKTRQRNILIGFLLMLSGIAFYIYRLIQRKHKQEQLVKDLHLEKKETELSTAQQQLIDFTANFQEKAQLLEQLEAQLQSKGTEEAQLLEQLQQSTLLTDDQWTSFRQVFDKVHGGYLIRLKEKLPDLTPAEIRYMALAKLRFNNKEMASALGISQQTVRVTVHRLRKKLNLPEEGSLTELVESI
jgi:tetratricopeptide (TPR) repeat protein